MIHLGDITKIDWAQVEPVDCVTGGSPCQDLSVAGKRAGLAGERSGLYMEQIRCIKELRENDRLRGRTGVAVRPRYMVWENVPGALSSNGGEDFRAVLEEAAKIADETAVIPRPSGQWSKAGCIVGNGFSIAWRVHDAQFWGVPQRRKRISVVADFGGLTAPEILFERKGVSGDFEPGGAQGKETAGGAGDGVASTITATYGTKWNGNAGAYSGGNFVIEPVGGGAEGASPCYGLDHVMLSGGTTYQGRGSYDDVSGCLKTQPHGVFSIQGNTIDRAAKQNGSGISENVAHTLNSVDRHGVVCLNDQGGSVMDVSEEKTGTLRAQDHGHPPLVDGFKHKAGAAAGSIGYAEETAPTMSAEQTSAVYDARGNGNGVTVPTLTGDHQNRVTDYTALCVGNGQLNQMSMAEQANTLDTMHDQQAVMVTAVDCRNMRENPEINWTLQAKESGFSYNLQNVCRTGVTVRRLTPLECERLQGYPDGWTDIGDWTDSKGKRHKAADSPRYKALGNSIALPYWFWLLRRISAQYERPATLGSLFDGIGGFPLCWERCNGKGTALWASEIEEFPMAVTKIRFPEEDIT